MNKKVVVSLLAIAVVAIVALIVVAGYFYTSLEEQKQENVEMQELARLDKQEMENEYKQFAEQYSEMKTKINNDSIIAQLTQEQMRTQQLLKELQNTKANDAREITRLKKELADVRAILREYVMTIDSLNRLNANLRQENAEVRGQLEESNRQNSALSDEKASLSEKVAIAAQLDAINIQLVGLNKKGKVETSQKKWKQIKVDFTIAKNVTAQGGMKTFYVRITTPAGSVLNAGSFQYENRQLQYSMKKTMEYDGQATAVTTFWNINEVHSPGTYRIDIFCDGHMIGNRSVAVK